MAEHLHLELVDLTRENATCAVNFNSQLLLGCADGTLKQFDSKYELLRSVYIGSNISTIMPLTTDLVAIIANQKCYIHNITTRKLVFEVPSSSVHDLAILNDQLFIASKYKLRILHLRSLVIKELSLGISAKIRSIGCWNNQLVIGTDGKILRLRNKGVETLVLIKGKPSIIIENDLMWVTTEYESKIYKYGPRGVQTVKTIGLQNRGVITDQNLGIRLFIGTKDSQIVILSPISGDTVAKKDVLNADDVLYSPFVLTNNKVKSINFSIDLAFITDETHKKFKLASLVPPNNQHCHDQQILQIQLKEIVPIIDEDLEQAMTLFTRLEVQDQENLVHNQILELITPLIDEFESNDSDKFETSSALHSTFSGISMKMSHKIEPIASYLAFTRRKLRLLKYTGPSLTILDTLLFKCYILMRSPLITSLLRSANHCDVSLVRQTLLNLGKWRELVYFLKSRRTNESNFEALELLAKHNEPLDSMVSWLEQMKPSWEVLTKFARPILHEKPELATQLFFENNFDNNLQIYDYLNSVLGPEWSGKYALHMVIKGSESQDLNENALIYLNMHDLPRCLDFAHQNKFIRPQKLIDMDLGLHKQVLAVLQTRLENYKLAMDLYFSLKDWQSAQTLIKTENLGTYFLSSVANSPMLDDFLANGNPTNVSLEMILEFLNNDLLLNKASGIISQCVLNQIQASNTEKLELGIQKSALTELSIQLAELESRKFEINEDTTCFLCHKNIGKAVCGAFNEEIVHYTCYKSI